LRNVHATGSSFNSLRATVDQVIVSDNDIAVPLSQLEVGMQVQSTKIALQLDAIQKSILLGILLGDGSLHYAENNGSRTSCSLRWTHSTKQEDYLDWAIQALGGLVKRKTNHTTGYGSDAVVAQTIFHPDMMTFFEGFNKPAGIIPERVVEMINPLTLAYWYMDDGSLSHHESQQDRATLATYSLTPESHQIVKEGLRRIGIDVVIQPSKKGDSLRLNKESADLMFCMIAPYIPPSMQYKLPVKYRGNAGWVPKAEGGLVSAKKTVDILRKEMYSKRVQGYELKTTTGNFYSSSVLLQSR
jgi:hypothetical protein